ncbi:MULTISPECIES: hypothetical protein [Burkholderia]|jgi:hypothetical protein|uniref:Uncharacterized protein n=1 Tax=Burkholderia cenocepacia TaxID=95486 RepID=A0A1V2WA38_9BURK|nr:MULTISPECIES: hypothetical protein [Burkholderia]AQQ39698.1 hypothetical protein A8E75_12175 [Burkholderia cenocepacia]ELW9528725.1 hypothetical protein [Burkholderia cenocepacia]ELW9532618.1 hypothetical protein [Burkholderia cenocepacia]KVF61250.1 hypothetical protein WJ14_08200 [Burkholderia cenocepacia]KWF26271.1 hypothetical protein WL84_13405 [Burkholderia cenocepacia]
MERSTSIEAGRRRASAWIAIALTLLLAYGVARHVSRASPALPQQRHFSVDVDRDRAPWARPVIAIHEGMPVHIDVHARETGVLMAHEIPGALAACASGSTQSLDIVPVGITGRFSLHFHSRTGDTIEVAVIEIYPGP